MNGKHSLDDLFARVLGDAEATPPAAVWEGVVRTRGWAHRTLQRLQRNWGYGLAAGLLLIGGAAFWVTAANNTATTSAAQPVAQAATVAPKPATSAGTAPTVASDVERSAAAPATVEGTSSTTSAASTAAANAPAGTNTAANGVAQPSTQAHTPAPDAPASTPARTERPERATAATSTSTTSHTTTSSPGTAGTSAPKTANTPHDAPNTATVSTAVNSTSAPNATTNNAAAVPADHANTNDAGTNGTVVATAPGMRTPDEGTSTATGTMPFATRQAGRFPAFLHEVAQAAPVAAPAAAAYVLPSSDWWIGVQSGFYQESRAWNGDNEALANALDRTETPHYPWSIGLAAGREYRSGWGFSLGAEYFGARYRFEHEDRFVQRTETTTEYLVTLNTQVIDSYVDTVVTVSEEHRTSRATNSYSAFRVPLEASYHKNWRRWQYGLRAGVAAEFITMRSGLTLSTEGDAGSEYAVDVAQTDAQQRSSTLLTGSLGIDLGYMINERFSLWATPGYAHGLFPIGSKDLYAMPDRWGVRFRLAYTFQHH